VVRLSRRVVLRHVVCDRCVRARDA
jgi:hypothetical protein